MASRTLVLIGSLVILCTAAIAIFLIPHLTRDAACVSPLALGTVVSGDQNGATVTVPPGAIVTIRLGEAFNVSSTVFPQSSNSRILRPATLCSKPELVSSLPSSITVFRAVAPGRADVALYSEPTGYANVRSATPPIFRIAVVVEAFDIVPWLTLGVLLAAEAALIYWILFRERRMRRPS
jgi:hypothetical protein